jgi:hypothetical protein
LLVAFWRHRLEAVSSAVQAKAANGFSDICLLAVWLMLLRELFCFGLAKLVAAPILCCFTPTGNQLDAEAARWRQFHPQESRRGAAMQAEARPTERHTAKRATS